MISGVFIPDSVVYSLWALTEENLKIFYKKQVNVKVNFYVGGIFFFSLKKIKYI